MYIGVVTEFDILKVLRKGKEGLSAVAEEIMTKDPICLEADQSVGEAIELMAEHHIIRIPGGSKWQVSGHRLAHRYS